MKIREIYIAAVANGVGSAASKLTRCKCQKIEIFVLFIILTIILRFLIFYEVCHEKITDDCSYDFSGFPSVFV